MSFFWSLLTKSWSPWWAWDAEGLGFLILVFVYCACLTARAIEEVANRTVHCFWRKKGWVKKLEFPFSLCSRFFSYTIENIVEILNDMSHRQPKYQSGLENYWLWGGFPRVKVWFAVSRMDLIIAFILWHNKATEILWCRRWKYRMESAFYTHTHTHSSEC